MPQTTSHQAQIQMQQIKQIQQVQQAEQQVHRAHQVLREHRHHLFHHRVADRQLQVKIIKSHRFKLAV